KEKRDEFIDKIILGKYTSIPIMLIMFGIILWITIKGSNYPSEILSSAFFNFEEFLSDKNERVRHFTDNNQPAY
ncbi:hypothetical protein OBE_11269, partial [human gut metagenome]